MNQIVSTKTITTFNGFDEEDNYSGRDCSFHVFCGSLSITIDWKNNTSGISMMHIALIEQQNTIKRQSNKKKQLAKLLNAHV